MGASVSCSLETFQGSSLLLARPRYAEFISESTEKFTPQVEGAGKIVSGNGRFRYSFPARFSPNAKRKHPCLAQLIAAEVPAGTSLIPTTRAEGGTKVEYQYS